MDARRFVMLSAMALALAAPSQAAPPAAETTGPAALARANRTAAEPSRLDRFIGGEQVFQFEAGRIFEVWTAPLRVTVLTLGRGEDIAVMAAGDTARWQIAEAASGEGERARRHVLIKPYERGQTTNLVITTNRRVYHLMLRSGPEASFNAAVSWRPEPASIAPPAPATTPAASPPPMLSTTFAIVSKGRRAPPWTPRAVMSDGARTYIAFPPSITAGPAPVLTLLGPAGGEVLANYRQQGPMFVVDGVIDAAQLSTGGARPQVVKIIRQPEPAP